MERLKLMAIDDADIAIISASLQDAVFKVADMAFEASKGVFTLEANRFVWEAGDKAKDWERRRSILAVKRVTGVRSLGVDRTRPDEVLSLLAIRFRPGQESPAGTIELVLAGGAIMAIDAECIEIQLSDVSGSWGTKFKPRHPLA